MLSHRSFSPTGSSAVGRLFEAHDADIERRRRLTRNRAIATALLGLMAVVVVGTHMIRDPGFAILLLRAGAEAGLVGGIADWFAVAALFRHPLGLPIPHTAIIPSNKDRIGQAIGHFVEQNFLTEEALLRKLRSAHVAQRFSAWLAAPETASVMADPVIVALPAMIRSLENFDLHKFVQRTVGEQLRHADLAVAIGQAVRVVAASGEADVLFERAIGIAVQWLKENRHRIDELVRERSRWWIPPAIDHRIAATIVSGITDLLSDLHHPHSRARAKFREALADLIDEVLNSPEQREQINAAKNRILDHPDVQSWLAAIWHALSRAMHEDLAQPRSKTRIAIENATVLLGRALMADQAMQSHLDALLDRLAVYLVSWRSEISTFIAEVVRNWDTRTVSERLELVVGSDLQYIRMNGTIVGACTGCLIFLASTVFP